MKQLYTKKLSGKIEVKTGLHIGGSSDTVQIGGIDSSVIKNPFTNEPYIPGSSIKGKMRSLVEWKLDKMGKKLGEPCDCGKEKCPVCRVFGCGNGSSKSETRGPTRIIVRDAVLSEKSKLAYMNGGLLTEEKAENSINRITAEANPRFMERVVPGVEFDFEISYRVIDTGDNGATDEKNFKEVVLEGLKMIQNDYLGGGGARGNGQVLFKDLKDENGKEVIL